MSFVIAAPESVTAAATDLISVGSTIDSAHRSAAAATTGIVAAAQDEVSTAVASLFSSYAKDYQSVSAQAAALHDRFVQALAGAATAYQNAEAQNVSHLTPADGAGGGGSDGGSGSSGGNADGGGGQPGQPGQGGTPVVVTTSTHKVVTTSAPKSPWDQFVGNVENFATKTVPDFITKTVPSYINKNLPDLIGGAINQGLHDASHDTQQNLNNLRAIGNAAAGSPLGEAAIGQAEKLAPYAEKLAIGAEALSGVGDFIAVGESLYDLFFGGPAAY